MSQAIENDFPFEEIDPVAELESWRKEIHRPIYHIHKWWAKRLGSVFRAIVLGSILGGNEDIWEHFYRKHDLSDMVVLDPFMGSGTTLGECAKLGIKAIGCDINPISSFIVKQALTRVDLNELYRTYKAIENDVRQTIAQYYKTIHPATGETCDVLYYFWVKVVKTPDGDEIPLFSSYVFSKNAYPKRKPEARIICPNCWSVNEGYYNSSQLMCSSCNIIFDPQDGPAKRQKITVAPGKTYKIKDLINASDEPPKHRLYAIMAVTPKGEKVYLTPQKYDLDLYNEASAVLKESSLPLPNMEVRPGHNTDQARGYNYKNWSHFFNDRQLLSLGIILERIKVISDEVMREQFLCLFSSTLEFNNLFCSFKGEGTGAVRHMFSNHIIKPERTPLENNVWGTEKSSGAFSTLFKSRLLKAKQYLNEPFEIQQQKSNGRASSARVNCNGPIEVVVTDNYDVFNNASHSALVLNGDSSSLPIPDNSVDAVVTDPPYFDFIHYSELSDFFYAWLAPVLKKEYSYFGQVDSSSAGEVQDKDPSTFSKSLEKVFSECNRTLKDGGLLIFSFHHSRAEAWSAIYTAIANAGFSIVSAPPVKAEMSVGKPKSASKNPINLDAILVCKKGRKPSDKQRDVWKQSAQRYKRYIERFDKAGRELSLGDQRVIMASQILVESSLSDNNLSEVKELLDRTFGDDFQLPLPLKLINQFP